MQTAKRKPRTKERFFGSSVPWFFSVFLLSFVFCLLSAVYAAEVSKIKIKKVGDQVKVVVFTDAVEYKDTVVKEPERIVIDFQNSFSNLPDELPSSYLPLLRIRTSQYEIEPPITRVVLDLEVEHPPQADDEIPYSISKVEGGVEIAVGKIVVVSTTGEEDTTKRVKELKELGKARVRDMKAETIPLVKIEQTKKDTTPKRFFYSPRGKHDPFKPYLGTVSTDTLLDMGSATIIGIMWSPKERYAVAEDKSGKRYILQEGDLVSGGRVIEIKKDEVIFLIRVFGGTKKVDLKLKR